MGVEKNHGWKKNKWRKNSLLPEFQCGSVHKRYVTKKIKLHVLFEMMSFFNENIEK